MLIPFDTIIKKYGKFNGILHLGANEGQELKEYYAGGISKSIWVEAIPDVFEKLQNNVKYWSNAIAVQACVSHINNQDVEFKIASNDGQSSSFLDFGTHSKEHPTVKFVDKINLKTIRCDSLFTKEDLTGFDFLAVDLQGADLLAVVGMGELLNQFRMVYIEVNQKELYRGCALINDVDSYLKLFGFRRVETKMTQHGWGDACYLKQS